MTKAAPIKIEQRKIADLVPFARNSRTHSDEQVAQIAASIREFGWTNPLLIDGKNTIIAGHGRLLAARKLDMQEVPAIVLDHLSEAQKRALVIADNKLALNAGWDFDLLESELQGLAEDDFDLSLIGFDEVELAQFLASGDETDPFTEWEAMPDFENPNNCHRKIIVSFETQDDVEDFFERLGQPHTDKTKSIWHPHKLPRDNESLRWV